MGIGSSFLLACSSLLSLPHDFSHWEGRYFTFLSLPVTSYMAIAGTIVGMGFMDDEIEVYAYFEEFDLISGKSVVDVRGSLIFFEPRQIEH